MALDTEGWAAVRRAYEETDEAVAAMARRFPVAAETIRRRAKREGWRRPVDRETGRRTRKPQIGQPTPGKRSGRVTDRAMRTTSRQTVDQAALLRRLYDAIDAKLQQLEARLASGQDMTAADSERETRELGSMIRSFEKVTAFASAIEGRRRTDGARTDGTAVSVSDAERMREEIAERLERLCQERPPAPQPRPAE